jgi:hypothetical protein
MSALQANSTARPRAADAQHLRRVDWRFLLPTPVIDRVLFVGPGESALYDALQACATEVICAADAGRDDARDPPRPFDLCVVESGDSSQLERAARLLRPGGWLYWESALRGRVSRRRRVLDRAGLRCISAWWHRPSFDLCQAIIPLDGPAPVLHLLRARARRFPAFVEVLAAGVIANGLVPGVPGSVSFVAQRPIASRELAP